MRKVTTKASAFDGNIVDTSMTSSDARSSDGRSPLSCKTVWFGGRKASDPPNGRDAPAGAKLGPLALLNVRGTFGDRKAYDLLHGRNVPGR